MKYPFVNYSNHPSGDWTETQIRAAEQYGPVIDLPFISVSAAADSSDIALIAENEVTRILEFQPAAVMCQGEMTLCFSIVSRLMALGIPVLAACSERCACTRVDEDGNTIKESKFVFRRFRRYT